VIIDALDRLSLYAGVHPLVLPTAIWLADATHHAAADGHHELAPGLAVIVETATTHPASARRYESHRENIDIQVNLSGGEGMDWTPVAGLRVADDFQVGGDIAFYHEPAQPGSRLLVMPGMFTLFLPGDAHKPVLHPFGQPVTYRKMVFKLRV
jgi:YhcH/YjgK/YiaL family protein